MVKPTKREETKLYRQGYSLIAGVDEVGRGAWAGPLVTAAVILPKACRFKGLNDSKKLSSQQRERLYAQIIKQALAYRVYTVRREVIDKMGMRWANVKALKQCAQNLSLRPEFILVDAVKIKVRNVPTRSIVKGDARVVSIAAASIVAKVRRDRLMVKYHKKYPKYNFHRHKGYGTAAHRRSVLKHGPCSLHRSSFEPIKSLVG